MNTNYVLSGGASLTLNAVDLAIAAGVSITVQNGATLTIVNSHLHSCYNMWQGIIVNKGAIVTMTNTAGKNNLVEDAIIAIDDINGGIVEIPQKQTPLDRVKLTP